MITPLKVKRLPFFDSFEDPLVKAILPYFTAKAYADGETILQQNKINTQLYFLAAGTVAVEIDGKLVVELDKVGEVFGEMSLANHSTCSATVKARGACEFLVFNFEEMRKGIDVSVRETVLKNFYKGAMEILAAKLLATNKRG